MHFLSAKSSRRCFARLRSYAMPCLLAVALVFSSAILSGGSQAAAGPVDPEMPTFGPESDFPLLAIPREGTGDATQQLSDSSEISDTETSGASLVPEPSTVLLIAILGAFGGAIRLRMKLG